MRLDSLSGVIPGGKRRKLLMWLAGKPQSGCEDSVRSRSHAIGAGESCVDTRIRVLLSVEL